MVGQYHFPVSLCPSGPRIYYGYRGLCPLSGRGSPARRGSWRASIDDADLRSCMHQCMGSWHAECRLPQAALLIHHARHGSWPMHILSTCLIIYMIHMI
jgi:hypothetical protein